MKHPRTLRIADYTYELPAGRIALFPKENRDESKLLVYDKGHIFEDIYKNIDTYLPAGSLIVLNETKVVHARLLFQKPSGGLIEVFCLEPDKGYSDIQTAMIQQDEVYWKCMVGGANKWKDSLVLTMFIAQAQCTLHAAVVSKAEGIFLLHLYWDKPHYTFAQVLQDIGKVPLPPYIDRETNDIDVERYQTIFAKKEGSVAAPTAGLHFTDFIFRRLKEKNIRNSFVTLHVGAGTFQPVKSEYISGHDMHAEWIDVAINFIEDLLQHDQPVIAVGTTSMRTLESLYWIGAKLYNGIAMDFSGIAVNQWDPYELETEVPVAAALEALVNYMHQKNLSNLVTQTKILIAPGYRSRIVNMLITNFHQPGSTLLLLVAAIAGERWQDMYRYALEHDFRFLSYGDGCLIKM